MSARHDFDVVVIGSGAGGLSAAAYLARAGRRVLLVEARDRVGGHITSFRHDSYEYDVGLHWTSEPMVQDVLRPLGVDVRFRDYDPDGMYRLHGPGHEIAVPRGLEVFRSRLHGTFPDEGEAIDSYLATVRLLADELQLLQERPHLRELPVLPWKMRGLVRYGTATAGGYLESLHASPALRSALLWANGAMAVAPSRWSLPVAAAALDSLMEGLSYPQGGSAAISDGLADVVRRNDGEIRTGTEVSRILVEKGRVRGVEIRNASFDESPLPPSEVLAPAVVSAVDVKQTYLDLLGPSDVPSRLLHRVRGYELTLPLAVVYLALDRDLAREGFPNSIFQVSGTLDYDAVYAALQGGDFPEGNPVIAWIANLADPDNPRLAPPGETVLQLMSLASPSHAWWGVAPGRGPTPRYVARAHQVRDQMIRSAEHVIPGLRASIVHEESATPISSERLMRVTGGTSYGPAFTARQAWTRLGPTSPIKGLFHAGATVRPSNGVAPALLSGVLAASAVTEVPTAELQAGPVTSPVPAS